MTHDDQDLQAWFETLRERDRASTPSFGAVLRRAEPRARRTPAFVAAIVLIVTLLATAHYLQRRPLPIEQLSAWRSPTQSLLDVPKSPLMSTTPSVTR